MSYVNKVLAVIAAFVVLPLLYGGAYLAMLDSRAAQSVPSGYHHRRVDYHPTYHFGAEFSRTFFYPANKVDAILRPKQWESEMLGPRLVPLVPH